MKSPSNFERLVLGRIDSYDSESRRIFQDFSRSTRFKNLCTAQTSKFQEKTRPKFCRNETFSFSFSFQQKSMNFVIFLLNFDKILPEFHEKFQEITKVLNILRNSARKILKMLEISGICEKFHFPCSFFCGRRRQAIPEKSINRLPHISGLVAKRVLSLIHI